MYKVYKVPAGFVPVTDEEVNPEGVTEQEFVNKLESSLYKVSVALYTDGCGTNYFVLEHEGKKLVLTVRTD